jgi:hypothetical protein
VIGIKCAGRNNLKTVNILKNIYSMLFFDKASADPYVLFASLHPPPKGGSEIILCGF